MHVQVVFDTSALLAYARLEDVAVGELVATVEEDADSTDSALIGIPAACVLAAYSKLARDDRARLAHFAVGARGITVILPLLGGDTLAVAELETELGEPGLGHAVTEVRKHAAWLATYAGRRARRVLSDDDILDL
ncbi:MAG TPA: hypothetical protein VGJ53_09745 [Micromonosporaceae bacterium]